MKTSGGNPPHNRPTHSCQGRAGGYLHLAKVHLLLSAEARGHEYSHPHQVTKSLGYICIFHLVTSKENLQKSCRLEGERVRCPLRRATRSANVSCLLGSLSPAHTHTGKCFCCEEMRHALPQMLLAWTWHTPTPCLPPPYGQLQHLMTAFQAKLSYIHQA